MRRFRAAKIAFVPVGGKLPPELRLKGGCMLEIPTKRAGMLSVSSHMQRGDTMITVRPGSLVHRLITLLSFTGEFPVRSLRLLGNERVIKALVHRLTSVQTFRFPDEDKHLTCKLLQINGKASGKSVRFYKGALPILDRIHPSAYEYYFNAFWEHRFPGDAAHRERNHRVAEAAALCMMAGIETRPYLLPPLQNADILQTVPDAPALYLAKDIKKIGNAEQNKTMFSRLVGTVFYPGACYAVYNTRRAEMKWSGMGEFKTLHNLIEIARMNAGIHEIDSALLFGESGDIALRTLLESDKSRRLEFRFDSIYQHVYFIPMVPEGIQRLRMLTTPDWNAKLLDILFEPNTRSYNKGFMEYDAYVDGVHILSHLDGDIARLVRFREALESRSDRFEVLCFPDQVPFLQEYLGPRARLKTIGMNLVESELGPDRRSLFE
jgi:hypothetical protein